MPYLISYFAAGILVAVGIAIHTPLAGLKGWTRFAIVIAIWPLLVLAAPDFLLRSSRYEEPDVQGDESTSSVLGATSESDRNLLSPEELLRFACINKLGPSAITYFGNHTDFDAVLEAYWERGIPPEAYHRVGAATAKLSDDYGIDSGVRFSLKEPEWYIGLSTEFVRSIGKIDKNKRARLLEGLAKLAASPITPYGDTIKPLTRELGGLWRMRFGDDRLIYKADVTSKRIVLISFAPRSQVYEGVSECEP